MTRKLVKKKRALIKSRATRLVELLDVLDAPLDELHGRQRQRGVLGQQRPAEEILRAATKVPAKVAGTYCTEDRMHDGGMIQQRYSKFYFLQSKMTLKLSFPC